MNTMKNDNVAQFNNMKLKDIAKNKFNKKIEDLTCNELHTCCQIWWDNN